MKFLHLTAFIKMKSLMAFFNKDCVCVLSGRSIKIASVYGVRMSALQIRIKDSYRLRVRS